MMSAFLFKSSPTTAEEGPNLAIDKSSTGHGHGFDHPTTTPSLRGLCLDTGFRRFHVLQKLLGVLGHLHHEVVEGGFR